jgi:hypothetical protein
MHWQAALAEASSLSSRAWVTPMKEVLALSWWTVASWEGGGTGSLFSEEPPALTLAEAETLQPARGSSATSRKSGRTGLESHLPGGMAKLATRSPLFVQAVEPG